MHILCTICSDLVTQAENINVTKCGHIFHMICLSQWIERSKSCPQCRNKVTENCMFRLYPTISSEPSGEDVATLQSRLDNALLQLRQQKASCKETADKIASTEAEMKKNMSLLKAYKTTLKSRDSVISAMKEQLQYLKEQNREMQKLREENESLKKNLQTLNGALCESDSKTNDTRYRLQAVKQKLIAEKAFLEELDARLVIAKKNIRAIHQKFKSMKNERSSDVQISDEETPSTFATKRTKTKKLNGPLGVTDSFDTSIPSEYAILSARNAARNPETNQSHKTSIFEIKEPI